MPDRSTPTAPSAGQNPTGSPQTVPPSRLPRAVWVLGVVSLFTDISSEMVQSLLPLFLVGSLGVSVSIVGLIEGMAQATALIGKVFSGVLSDWIGRRKGLTVAGYTLSALTKPIFALASSAGWIVTGRFLDRVGKGLRDAPRDALLADLVPSGQRGAAFGLRQALDTVGAVIGPLTATALMILWAGDFRAVFWVAVIPAWLAVLLMMAGVQETRPIATAAPIGLPIDRARLARLTPAFWRVVGIGAMASLARFSDAFLVLRAQQAGIAAAWVPLVMVAMNLVYAATAYPAGWLADRLGPRRLLGAGLILLVVADALLASATDGRAVLAGVLLWGAHMGLTQGLLAAMVADAAPEDLRGTAYGMFNLSAGIALLVASSLAGQLWDHWGAGTTFWIGAGFAALTLVMLKRR